MDLEDILPEEEAALRALARRHREAQSGEAKLLEKYGARAALAKQVWSVVAGFVVSLVVGTEYVNSIKMNVAQNTKELANIRADLTAAQKEITQLEILMARKVDISK